MLTFSPSESARFDMRTFRAVLSGINVNALFEEIVAQRVDLAILRLPTRESEEIRSIQRFGLHPIHADTLVSYECHLQECETRPLRDPLRTIDPAGPSDTQAIIELVKAVFADYPNHYHANPMLDRAAVLDGYCEWALNHLEGDHQIAWVARANGHVAGIACSTFDPATRVCQGVLHGVHPDCSGSGIYTDLIRYTQRYFCERGYRTLKISTQIGNLPVQRVWVREGFVFAEVFDTFHVNALLDLDRTGATQTVTLSDADSGQLLRGQAMTRFLAVALSTQRERQGSTKTGTEECFATILDELENEAEYLVRVRRYERAHLPDHAFCSATLHDVTGKICGMAQFVTP
ncbi:MAG: GNAT family N-acetyltransferase [Rhodanobacteraceae bacterium]